jgi:CPA1 family monovalent cation:H+ antiporter
MEIELLSELLIILLIACVVGIAVKYVRLPYTIALVAVGSLIGFLELLPEITLTKEIVFYLVLPPLLFEGALNTELQHFRENLKPIGLLSTAGVLISVLVVGYIIHVSLAVPLAIALLFGAMITPTDPVSVLATFKTLGAPKRLTTIVEGESILNDGTAVVIFAIIFEMIRGGEFSVTSGVIQFFSVCAIGTTVGLMVGYMAYRMMVGIDDAEIEVALTLVIAFSTFILAELLHGSGVIAVVAAGLLIGNYGRYFGMSPSTRVTLTVFWGMIVFLVNSVVFILIGLDIASNLSGYLTGILIAIGAVLLARAVAVYLILSLPGMRIPWMWRHIVFWGGLRGTIPVALALSLGDVPYRELLASLTLGVVLFSLIFQGLSLEIIISRTSVLRRDEKKERYDEVIARNMALMAAKRELEKMIVSGEIPDEVAERINRTISEEMEEAKLELDQISSELSSELETDVWKKMLIAAKSAVRDAAIRGRISIDAAKKVEEELNQRLLEFE